MRQSAWSWSSPSAWKVALDAAVDAPVESAPTPFGNEGYLVVCGAGESTLFVRLTVWDESDGGTCLSVSQMDWADEPDEETEARLGYMKVDGVEPGDLERLLPILMERAAAGEQLDALGQPWRTALGQPDADA